MQKLRNGAGAFALIFSLLLFVPALPAQEKTPAGKPQEICPAMGGPINRNVYVDYQGQRVYFCCPACIEVFKKDPETYLKKMKEAGVTPEKTPAKQ